MEPRPRLVHETLPECFLFKMVNDSIYFINEVKYIYSYDKENSTYFKDEAKFISYQDEANSIFRIHKSGKGKVRTFPPTHRWGIP